MHEQRLACPVGPGRPAHSITRAPATLPPAVGFGLVYGWATNQDVIIWYEKKSTFPYIGGELPCGPWPARPALPTPFPAPACCGVRPASASMQPPWLATRTIQARTSAEPTPAPAPRLPALQAWCPSSCPGSSAP